MRARIVVFVVQVLFFATRPGWFVKTRRALKGCTTDSEKLVALLGIYPEGAYDDVLGISAGLTYSRATDALNALQAKGEIEHVAQHSSEGLHFFRLTPFAASHCSHR